MPTLRLQPFGVFIGRLGQGHQCGLLDPFEKIPPTGTQMPGDAGVERVEQLPDRRVQLAQREEPPLAQARQDPALHELDADLRLGFIARLIRTRGDDGRAVMRSKVGVGPVDLWAHRNRPWSHRP